MHEENFIIFFHAIRRTVMYFDVSLTDDPLFYATSHLLQ